MVKKRVLVVEDSLTQGEKLRYELEGHGFEAHLESNGREALAALDAFSPDVALTDILMPEMDGYALGSRSLRKMLNAWAGTCPFPPNPAGELRFELFCRCRSPDFGL